MLLAVPEKAVDPVRSDAALRAAGVPSGLRPLDAGEHSVLDTPQDMARSLAGVLWRVPRADQAADRAG